MERQHVISQPFSDSNSEEYVVAHEINMLYVQQGFPQSFPDVIFLIVVSNGYVLVTLIAA